MTCKTCGAPLSAAAGAGRPRQFCNDSCRRRNAPRPYQCRMCGPETVYKHSGGGRVPNYCPAHRSAAREARKVTFFTAANAATEVEREPRRRMRVWTRLDNAEARPERLDKETARALWWATQAHHTAATLPPGETRETFNALAEAFTNDSRELSFAATVAYARADTASDYLEVFDTYGTEGVTASIVNNAATLLDELDNTGADALAAFAAHRAQFRAAGGVLAPPPVGVGR